MNKKEQQAFDDLKADLAAARALSWPSYPVPLRTVAASDGETVSGWNFNARRDYDSVFEAWSTTISHGEGRNKPSEYGSGSQGRVRLFATRADALRALRYEKTERFARELAKIDAQIAEAEVEAEAQAKDEVG